MLSIVQILALQFVNRPFQAKSERDKYYVLMHFINQKLATFYTFLDHKFRMSENYTDVRLTDSELFKLSESTPLFTDSDESIIKIESTKGRQIKKDSMRRKLEDNIPQFEGQLAEMATSKQIEFKVRKKARSICRKHGIDYINWAKNQIKLRNLDENDFILR
jgi:hypothetical protein